MHRLLHSRTLCLSKCRTCQLYAESTQVLAATDRANWWHLFDIELNILAPENKFTEGEVYNLTRPYLTVPRPHCCDMHFVRGLRGCSMTEHLPLRLCARPDVMVYCCRWWP